MRRHNSNSTIAWSDFPQEISGNFNILFDFSKKNSMFRKKFPFLVVSSCEFAAGPFLEVAVRLTRTHSRTQVEVQL
jgi:hypothetical protein